MTGPAAALEARDLTIGYRQRGGDRVVCRDISCAVHAGTLVCLLGPNGAGKSTLLSTLGGTLPSLSGAVLLAGELLGSQTARERARSLAIVTTERVSTNGLTARRLVTLGRHPHTAWTGALTHVDQERIDTALSLAGASEFATRPVSELSDGERQRVLLARALAQSDRVLILDELTAFLDLPRRVETMRMLRALARESGRAILLSTHDLDLALRSADRLWLLPPGGPLVQGTPEDLVLRGGFAQVFNGGGVEFDITTGTFRMDSPHERAVLLTGEGIAVHWTSHALVRNGWNVLSVREGAERDASLPLVAITERGWELIARAGSRHASSIEELLLLMQ